MPQCNGLHRASIADRDSAVLPIKQRNMLSKYEHGALPRCSDIVLGVRRSLSWVLNCSAVSVSLLCLAVLWTWAPSTVRAADAAGEFKVGVVENVPPSGGGK